MSHLGWFLQNEQEPGMGDHSVEGTWCDSRLKVAVWEGDVRNKRRTGIPGGLVAKLLWEFASSTGSPCSE